jgi:Protein of unknown function (DUF2802)
MSTLEMMTIDISNTLAGTAALISLISLAAVIQLYRALVHWRERCMRLEAVLPGLQREIERFASISVRTGRQVKRIESEYSDVVERVDLVEARGPAKALGEAIDSARRGADTRRLSVDFGLSRGEAELVARLHGRKMSA